MQPDPGLAQTLEGSRAAPALERLKSGKRVGPMVRAERWGTGGWRGGGGHLEDLRGAAAGGQEAGHRAQGSQESPCIQVQQEGSCGRLPRWVLPLPGSHVVLTHDTRLVVNTKM